MAYQYHVAGYQMDGSGGTVQIHLFPDAIDLSHINDPIPSPNFESHSPPIARPIPRGTISYRPMLNSDPATAFNEAMQLAIATAQRLEWEDRVQAYVQANVLGQVGEIPTG